MEASQAPNQSQPSENQVGLPEEGNQQPIAQPNPDIRKIKLNGEEREVSLEDIKRNLDIEEWDPKYEKQLIQAYQKSLAADHRFNEVNMTKKEVEAAKKQIALYNQLLVQDPETLLGELLEEGKLDEIAFRRIQRRFELEQMTPDQRAAYEATQALNKEKSEKQQYQERLQQFEHEQAVSQHIQNESQAMIEAVTKSSLPKDKFTLELMASTMVAGYTAEQAANRWEQNMPKMVDVWLQNATPEQIKQALSKQARDKMQSFTVGQIARKPNNNAPPPGTVPQRPQNGEQQDYKAIRKQRLEAAFSGMEL